MRRSVDLQLRRITGGQRPIGDIRGFELTAPKRPFVYGPAAASQIGAEHHAIDASTGQHALRPWHINKVNEHHSRLKNWLRRFNGVASC